MSRIALAEVLPVQLTASIAPECLAARARIESARIGAQEDFFETRQQDPPAGFSAARHDLYAFLNYVATVRFAVNHELCLLGRRRKWRHIFPADHIRECSESFLESFTILIAHPEDGRNRYDQPLEGVIERYMGHSTLSSNFRKGLEKHELWRKGEKELKAVADHQGGKPRTSPPAVPSPPGRPKLTSTNQIEPAYHRLVKSPSHLPTVAEVAQEAFGEDYTAAKGPEKNRQRDRVRKHLKRALLPVRERKASAKVRNISGQTPS